MGNYIAEYNNMWNKLNAIAEHHNNLFIFTLTSSGAILTYALQQSNSYITLVNMVILILLRCRVMNYRDEYYQVLAYIRMILEPKIGLDSKKLMSLSNTKIANLQYFIYAIFGFGTVLECILIDKSSILVIIISIILFAVIVILDVYYYFYSKKLYEKYEHMLS
jgi:hypothetical protein